MSTTKTVQEGHCMDNDSIPEIEVFDNKFDGFPNATTQFSEFYLLIKKINIRSKGFCFKHRRHPSNDLIIYKETLRIAWRIHNKLLEDGYTQNEIKENFDYPTDGLMKLEEWCYDTSKSLKKPKGIESNQVSDSWIKLLEFMQKFCEEKAYSTLISRRKSLNDAHSRGLITLPGLATSWKTGQSKYYNTADLLKEWPNYRSNLPNLPALKQQS